MESTRVGVDTSCVARVTIHDSRGGVKETRTVIGRQECISRFNVHFRNMRPDLNARIQKTDKLQIKTENTNLRLRKYERCIPQICCLVCYFPGITTLLALDTKSR